MSIKLNFETMNLIEIEENIYLIKMNNGENRLNEMFIKNFQNCLDYIEK